MRFIIILAALAALFVADRTHDGRPIRMLT